jgi:hypothetical protein
MMIRYLDIFRSVVKPQKNAIASFGLPPKALASCAWFGVPIAPQ